MSVDRRALLASLGLEAVNPGACAGPEAWRGSGPLLESRNPADGSSIAAVATAASPDIDAVLGAAAAAAHSWREVPAPKRGEAVRRLGQLLREHKDALGTLVSLETGKIRSEGLGEVQEMIDLADFAVGRRACSTARPCTPTPGPSDVRAVASARRRRSDHRVQLPGRGLGRNALLAAVCGNATVWKPSPKTPLAAIAVQKLCNRVIEELALPPIFTLLIDSQREAAVRLANDPGVPLVSFTGSSAVGRQIAQSVAARFGRCLAGVLGQQRDHRRRGCGSRSRRPAVVFGAVGTAGQRCTTTRRLIVHESIETELVRWLRAAYAQVRIGTRSSHQP
jgi:aldehyde dehydrogenase (NAD+)